MNDANLAVQIKVSCLGQHKTGPNQFEILSFDTFCNKYGVTMMFSPPGVRSYLVPPKLVSKNQCWAHQNSLFLGRYDKFHITLFKKTRRIDGNWTFKFDHVLKELTCKLGIFMLNSHVLTAVMNILVFDKLTFDTQNATNDTWLYIYHIHFHFSSRFM